MGDMTCRRWNARGSRGRVLRGARLRRLRYPALQTGMHDGFSSSVSSVGKRSPQRPATASVCSIGRRRRDDVGRVSRRSGWPIQLGRHWNRSVGERSAAVVLGQQPIGHVERVDRPRRLEPWNPVSRDDEPRARTHTRGRTRRIRAENRKDGDADSDRQQCPRLRQMRIS
jgi:hypothetical protein